MQSTSNRIEALAILAFILWIVLTPASRQPHHHPERAGVHLHLLLSSRLDGSPLGTVYHHLHASFAGPE